MMLDEPLSRVLTIAGSDSGGGAGIQADVKTFAAFRVFGMSVLTAITAQNTVGVQAVQVCPAELVVEQMKAVLSDLGTDAIKIGMLANRSIVEVVADTLSTTFHGPIVLDPVMVAKGMALLDAVASAKGYVFQAIASAANWSLGNGHGPINHNVASQFVTEHLVPGGTYQWMGTGYMSVTKGE